MAKKDAKSGAGCAAIFLLILAVVAAWFAWPLLIGVGVALGVAVAIKRAAAPTSTQAMPSTTRRNLIILAVVVGGLAVSGEVAWGVFLANHGKSNNNAGTTQDVGAGSPDVPPASAAAPRVFVMPNLVGESLSDATAELHAHDIYGIRPEDCIQSRMVLDASNWEVVAQIPLADQGVSSSDDVTLYVAKYSDPSPICS